MNLKINGDGTTSVDQVPNQIKTYPQLGIGTFTLKRVQPDKDVSTIRHWDLRSQKSPPNKHMSTVRHWDLRSQKSPTQQRPIHNQASGPSLPKELKPKKTHPQSGIRAFTLKNPNPTKICPQSGIETITQKFSPYQDMYIIKRRSNLKDTPSKVQINLRRLAFNIANDQLPRTIQLGNKCHMQPKPIKGGQKPPLTTQKTNSPQTNQNLHALKTPKIFYLRKPHHQDMEFDIYVDTEKSR